MEERKDIISRQAAIDALKEQADAMSTWTAERYKQQSRGIRTAINILEDLPSAQPDITDEQAIEHLQKSGWMQSHDKQMYEAGLRERLADDSGSYDALLPSAQPEQIARDIATVIENEKDMRVILKNAQPDKKEEWKMRFVLKDVRAVEIENNKVNLCDSCLHEFATCASGSNDTFFGDGKGNDNVCCCSCYKPLQSKQKQED